MYGGKRNYKIELRKILKTRLKKRVIGNETDTMKSYLFCREKELKGKTMNI